MAEEKKSKLESVLAKLKAVGDIEASAVVRRDGLIIADNLPGSINNRTVAAMSAAIVGTAETSSAELQRGRFLQVIVESEKGKLVATGAGQLAILVCLIRPTANLGLVLLEMGKVSGEISNMLGR